MPIQACVGALAAALQAGIDAITLAIEAPVDAISLAVQLLRETRVALLRGLI